MALVPTFADVPRLPVEILYGIADILAAQADTPVEHIVMTRARHIQLSSAQRESRVALLNLTAANKQTREAFWRIVWPKFIAPDNVLRIYVRSGQALGTRSVPIELIDRAK